MQEDFRDRSRKNVQVFNIIRNIVMAILFLIMGVLMIGAEKFNVTQLLSFDSLFRNIFGGICIVYSLFRIYRATKRDY